MSKLYSIVLLSTDGQTFYSVGLPIRDRSAYSIAMTDPNKYGFAACTILAGCTDRDGVDALVAQLEAKGIARGYTERVKQTASVEPPEKVKAMYRCLYALIGAGDRDMVRGNVAEGCSVEVAGDSPSYWFTAAAVEVTDAAEARIRAIVAALPAQKRDWVTENTSWMTTRVSNGPVHTDEARFLLIDANVA